LLDGGAAPLLDPPPLQEESRIVAPIVNAAAIRLIVMSQPSFAEDHLTA